MGMMEDMQKKGKSLTDNPGNKAKIEQMAKDKGISLQEAKEKFKER